MWSEGSRRAQSDELADRLARVVGAGRVRAATRRQAGQPGNPVVVLIAEKEGVILP